MDEDGPADECEVCGGTDFYKEAGHFYCSECQTQSQQIREQVFELEEATINKKSTKKAQKANKNTEDKLTSWECYNIILKGLTKELIELGAKPELKLVVRYLWMKYLHKCEVFDIKSDKPPKVSILGSKKDIEILYNLKRRKRRRSRTLSTSTTMSIHRQRSKKKRALIHSQYDELSQSQTLTQDTSAHSQTLSTVKSGSEKSDSSEEIKYNRYSNAVIKRMMSRKHQNEHKHDVHRELPCHKFSCRTLPRSFVVGPTVLTSFTLYGLIYIGLIIVKDPIQLGDILRYIREGHLSFGRYRHFFDEDLSDKALHLPKKIEILFTSDRFRQKTAALAHFLEVETYIKKPDLIQLCFRYCTELNLPACVFEYVEKLIFKTSPKMEFDKNSSEIPNYEGRAMSFILFVLKLVFCLDGATENKLSDYAKLVNNQLVGSKMFNVKEWLRYIGYRNTVVRTHHMPNSIQNCDNINSDMYLDYVKNQKINFRNTEKHIQQEIKDFLLVFDKILEEDDSFEEDKRFKHSLTPFLSYAKEILVRGEVKCEDILKQTFSEDSMEFLLRPNKYLKLVNNKSVKNGGANDNVVVDVPLYVRKEMVGKQRPYNTVTVTVSDEIKDDVGVKAYLDKNEKDLVKHTDCTLFLSNYQNEHARTFRINKTFLQFASENAKVNVKEFSDNAEIYDVHYNTFERYWLNVPTNPTTTGRYVTKERVEKIMSKLPDSFRMVLRECARIVEQGCYDFYSEFLVTELNLVFEKYSTKARKKRAAGIQKVIKDCSKKW